MSSLIAIPWLVHQYAETSPVERCRHGGFKSPLIDSQPHRGRFWVRHDVGITKSDHLPDAENLHRVVFVEIGYSGMSVAIVAFSKRQLFFKSTAYDTHLCVRDIDYALVRHVSEELKTKYKLTYFQISMLTVAMAWGTNLVPM